MVVNVHRRKGHLIAAGAAVWWIDSHHEPLRRRIVGHGDEQTIAGTDVQCGILEPSRRHEAVERPACGVARRLVGELDRQRTVLTEQSRRLIDDAAGAKRGQGLATGATEAGELVLPVWVVWAVLQIEANARIATPEKALAFTTDIALRNMRIPSGGCR
jgi:hypothetical protein